MAKLYITELARITAEGAMAVPPLNEQSLPIGVKSAVSDKLRGGFILVHADAPCCLAFGPEPEADPEKHRLPADHDRVYAVNPADRIAVIESE